MKIYISPASGPSKRARNDFSWVTATLMVAGFPPLKLSFPHWPCMHINQHSENKYNMQDAAEGETHRNGWLR